MHCISCILHFFRTYSLSSLILVQYVTYFFSSLSIVFKYCLIVLKLYLTVVYFCKLINIMNYVTCWASHKLWKMVWSSGPCHLVCHLLKLLMCPPFWCHVHVSPTGEYLELELWNIWNCEILCWIFRMCLKFLKSMSRHTCTVFCTPSSFLNSCYFLDSLSVMVPIKPQTWNLIDFEQKPPRRSSFVSVNRQATSPTVTSLTFLWCFRPLARELGRCLGNSL